MAYDDYILRSDALTALMTAKSLTPIARLEALNRILPIPAADVEPKRRWIPVTEKPPEAGVIVWDGDHTPFTADEIVSKEYDGETMYFVPKYMVNVPIIAWISPPEPPEVES